MSKNIWLLFLLFVCSANGQIITTSEIATKSLAENKVIKNNDECLPVKFHYLIVENELYSPTMRHMEIFLDEKAFSEENLKILFEYLSVKNPKPVNLTISVKTNWAQLSLIYDCPPTIVSGKPDSQDKYDYHQAVFFRRNRTKNNKYFTYNPMLKTDDFKTVMMED
jgi:hypothetical protein